MAKEETLGEQESWPGREGRARGSGHQAAGTVGATELSPAWGHQAGLMKVRMEVNLPKPSLEQEAGAAEVMGPRGSLRDHKAF